MSYSKTFLLQYLKALQPMLEEKGIRIKIIDMEETKIKGKEANVVYLDDLKK